MNLAWPILGALRCGVAAAAGEVGWMGCGRGRGDVDGYRVAYNELVPLYMLDLDRLTYGMYSCTINSTMYGRTLAQRSL